MKNYRNYNDRDEYETPGIGREYKEIEKKIRDKNKKYDRNDKFNDESRNRSNYTKESKEIEDRKRKRDLKERSESRHRNDKSERSYRDERSQRSDIFDRSEYSNRSKYRRSEYRTPEVKSLSSADWNDDDDDKFEFKVPLHTNKRKDLSVRRDIQSSVRSNSTICSPNVEEEDIDENWYNMGESDDYNPFDKVYEENAFTKKVNQLRTAKLSKRSHYAVAREEANKLWEDNRLLSSGVLVLDRGSVEIDDEDDGQHIVNIHVHNILPPFLDGRIVFTKQFEPIIPVKDSLSDLAKIAQAGSATVKHYKDLKEKMKLAKQTTDLSGTALGNFMGIQTEEKLDTWTEANSKDSVTYSNKLGKGQVTREEKLKIDYTRKTLPIYRVRDQLMRLIRENQVLVIVGETGSGKTTQLTQYLYEECYHNRGIIGCTQPRRVAAVSVASRVANEVGTTLGGKVGYSIRFEDCKSEDTVIKYMTDGILLRESLRDGDLDDYSVIIMDEAHERTLNTDILFGILKEIIQRRVDLHLVVTSATMDAEKFSKFFGNCGIFKIPGRTYPVDVIYEKSTVSDPVAMAVDKAVDTHLGSDVDSGDILVFMSGQEDVEVTCGKIRETLEEFKDRNPKELKVEPLYSQLSSELQSQVFRVNKDGPRRCIVATNIAETSVTLDGIRYVIDNGYCKMKVFNSRVGMDTLQTYPISQASANQRAGRAGRTGPGICYRLYTNDQYDNQMLTMTVPEIQRTNLTNVVLLLKSLNVNDLMNFNFMDSPPRDNIFSSMHQLWMLGALDNNGNLTDMGRKMAEFPLEPSLSKMLIKSMELGCSDEILTIVSMMSVPMLFYRPITHRDDADNAHSRFQVAQSDHVTLLNVYRIWRQNGYSSAWCKRNYLHYKSLKRVREVRQQLKEIIDKLEMKLCSVYDDTKSTNSKQEELGLEGDDLLRYCICSAYFSQACRWKSAGVYINLRTGVLCHLHPTSALYNMAFSADYVVYHELMMTTREYMNYVTHVDPHWLAELGYMFYSIKQAGVTTENLLVKERQTQQRMHTEMEMYEAQQSRRQQEQQNRIQQRDSERQSQRKTPSSRREN